MHKIHLFLFSRRPLRTCTRTNHQRATCGQPPRRHSHAWSGDKSQCKRINQRHKAKGEGDARPYTRTHIVTRTHACIHTNAHIHKRIHTYIHTYNQYMHKVQIGSARSQTNLMLNETLFDSCTICVCQGLQFCHSETGS